MRTQTYFAALKRLGLLFVPVWLSVTLSAPVLADGKVLTLQRVIELAKQADPALARFNEEKQAYVELSRSVDYWPDPTLFLAAQNLPIDSFQMNQEPMTQVRAGIKQMLPRGESLTIQQNVLSSRAQHTDWQQQAYWAALQKDIHLAWLDAWFWQKKQALLREDAVFLEQVIDFIDSLYQVGARDQSDLLGAQLDLLKLEEMEIEASRHYLHFRFELDRLAAQKLDGEVAGELAELHLDLMEFPDFTQHAEYRVLEARRAIAYENVRMAEQAYQPMWGFEISYGMRQGDNMDGSDRVDFASAGVSVQLPLFSPGRVDGEVQAAQARGRAEQLRLDDYLIRVSQQYRKLQVQAQRLRAQLGLYQKDVLPLLGEQKEAALQAYQADRGDFKRVSELYRKEQLARIAEQQLLVEVQKNLAQLAYWHTNAFEQSSPTNDRTAYHHSKESHTP